MKKIIMIALVFSVFALGMAKKPAAAPVNENKAATTGTSQAAPDFKLKDISGKEVKLSDYKGKKAVLLVFWATWCVYCRQEIPELIALQEQCKSKNLEILGINIQEEAGKVKPFLEKSKVNYTILLDIKGEVARAYEVKGIPMNILVDQKGNVIYGGSFGEQVKTLIAQSVK